jgi:hypothetical protein
VIGPRTFLVYRDYRYLKVASAALLVAVLVYAFDSPVGGPSGGTWLGYTYGAIALCLMLWLMWFGVRKRSYRSAGPPLRGWLSAHVYLGLSLLVLVPLHSGFQFGWNVHTLAYALVVCVVATGIAGIYFYASVPAEMTRNKPGQKLEALFQQIADGDAELKGLASALPDHFAHAVARCIDQTRIGGGLLRQLSGRQPDCSTERAMKEVRTFSQDLSGDSKQRADVRRLLELLSLRQALLGRIRRDLRYKSLLDIWLVVHVPLSFAAVIAVFVHVFTVFYYW